MFSSSVPGLWDQRQRLGIPFVTSGAFFGIGIAIDGSTLMVGAEGVSHGASGSGSAFVYTLDLTGAWALEAELASAAPATSGTFGQSVAIANDRIVVGDPHPEAAFLYERIASQGCCLGGCQYASPQGRPCCSPCRSRPWIPRVLPKEIGRGANQAGIPVGAAPCCARTMSPSPVEPTG